MLEKRLARAERPRFVLDELGLDFVFVGVWLVNGPASDVAAFNKACS